jgi:hypothetical protein
MKVRSRWLRISLLCSALVTLGLACGGDEAGKPETAAAVPAATPQPTAEPQTQARLPADQLRQHMDLPEYYPPDAPLYPGTKPSDAQQLANGRVTAVFGTSDSIDQVLVYMQGSLPEQGWTVTVEQSMPQGMIMQAVKPDRLLSVLLSRYGASPEEELTIIAISVDR